MSVSPKWKTIVTTKQTSKLSQVIAEMNANVEHAFTVLKHTSQLANSTKIFGILLVLFKKTEWLLTPTSRWHYITF